MHLRHTFSLLTLLLLVSMLPAASSIKHTSSFADLAAMAESVNGQTLILLDFAKVICTHKDPWMRGHKEARQNHESIKSFSKRLSALAKSVSDKAFLKRLKTFYGSRKYGLVDPALPELIKKMQDRGAKVIALTSFKASKFPDLARQRHEALAKVGIDFSKAFPDHSNLALATPTVSTATPTFSDGVLCNGGDMSKGEVLTAFLQAINWRPAKVIFYDDRQANVESVQAAMQQLGISFEGFVYHGAKQLPSFFDPAIAAYQVEHLVKHKKWLSGKKVQALLEKAAANAA